MSGRHGKSAICVMAFGAALIALSGCTAEVDEAPAEPVGERAQAAGSCVPQTGHWNFWGACAEDVPLAAGSAVYSASSGQVVNVYPSCGGYAGQSIRVDYGDGKYMYAHVNAAVSIGSWVSPGTYLGSVFSGPSAVYCNASLTSCGYGYNAAQGRTTLCWSGPHLHREGPCCGAQACTFSCSDYGYSPGQCVSGWQCNWPCIDYTGCGGGGGGSACAGACGGQAASGCWCDSQCAYYGDCCSDGSACSACGHC